MHDGVAVCPTFERRRASLVVAEPTTSLRKRGADRYSHAAMEDFPGRLESRLGPLFAYRKRHGGPTAWLGSRFALADRIDRGGTSLVVRAWDRETDGYVAVKLMAASVFDSRAREEADALSKLRHPGIVRIVAAGTGVIAIDAERIECTYVAMELVSWPTLGDWLRDARPPPRSRLRVLLGLAETLQAVHALGLVHRDIKPKNVLVSPIGETKLIDFGFAIQTDTKGDAKTVDVSAIAGTPGYLPPEAVLHRIGPRSDQYQFGVLGIEALTDGRPGRPTPIGVRQTLEEALGSDVLPIFEKASAFDPEARFRSMDEVVAKLRRAVEPRRVSRRGVLLALVGASAGVGAVAWWRRDRDGTSDTSPSWLAPGAADVGDSECGQIAETVTLATWVRNTVNDVTPDATLRGVSTRYSLSTDAPGQRCESEARLVRTGIHSEAGRRFLDRAALPTRRSETVLRALAHRRASLLDLLVEFEADTRIARRRLCCLVDGTSRLVGLVSGEEIDGGVAVESWTGLVFGATDAQLSERIANVLRPGDAPLSSEWSRTAGWNGNLPSSTRLVDVTRATPTTLLTRETTVSTATTAQDRVPLRDVDLYASAQGDVTVYRAPSGVGLRVGRMMAFLREASPRHPPSSGWGWLGTCD